MNYKICPRCKQHQPKSFFLSKICITCAWLRENNKEKEITKENCEEEEYKIFN